MKTIDTCGLSCPQPLMLTKQAIAANYSEMEILVDSQPPKLLGPFGLRNCLKRAATMLR